MTDWDRAFEIEIDMMQRQRVIVRGAKNLDDAEAIALDFVKNKNQTPKIIEHAETNLEPEIMISEEIEFIGKPQYEECDRCTVTYVWKNGLCEHCYDEMG
jgi:hypothetical protein